MEEFQKDFIRFITERGALKFGEFTTKSGRLSPYFFNAGGLHRGDDLLRLGEYYAQALKYAFEEIPGVIYGPAYKGIPLSVVTASSIYRLFSKEVCYCFNRKEAKDHGEKGSFVGKAPAAGDSLVIIDDVMTAGTSVRETLDLLGPIEGLEIKGILVAVDRQERGMNTELSAFSEIRRDFGLEVHAIVKLEHIFEMLAAGEIPGVDPSVADRIYDYRKEYGV